MEHFDVLIVGAGLSGIGAAVHLQQRCPGKRYAILEGRAALGGTWDVFRYPGIRSDSDMHTLGYEFQPWREAKALADGPSILNYLQRTAREHGVDHHIRYRHSVRRASWSSAEARWTLEVERPDTGKSVQLSCNFLSMCAGYYSHRHGFTPEWADRERFRGTIVHPQAWPEALDYRGKKVVVIGSGATAVTLVPALARGGAEVVMLQRSPSWVLSVPARDPIANALVRVLPERMAYAATRFKNVRLQQLLYRTARARPAWMKKLLLGRVQKALGPDYDVGTHFTPRYDPWDQRLCFVPDDDLFDALRSGNASVVTDRVERFTERGLQLASGRELEADIVVTATGLELVVLGEVEVRVDGAVVDFADTWTYKGIMCSGVPNLVSTFGYVNASWTLRADLIAQWLCRLVTHMDRQGARIATPRLRPGDADMPARPWIEGFTPGYIQRSLHRFPKQGDREPWQNRQDYRHDQRALGTAPIADGVLAFE